MSFGVIIRVESEAFQVLAHNFLEFNCPSCVELLSYVFHCDPGAEGSY